VKSIPWRVSAVHSTVDESWIGDELLLYMILESFCCRRNLDWRQRVVAVRDTVRWRQRVLAVRDTLKATSSCCSTRIEGNEIAFLLYRELSQSKWRELRFLRNATLELQDDAL